MKNVLFMSLLFIGGCSSHLIHYSPSLLSESTASFVEQIVYEQPNKYRPSAIVVTKNFVEFTYSISAKNSNSVFEVSDSSALKSGTTITPPKDIRERYYFNSMSSPKLFKKRDWYIVQLVDRSGKSLKNIFTLSEIKAKKCIDEIYGLINNAS